MRFTVLLNQEKKEIEVIRLGDQLRISYDGQTFEVQLVHTDGAHFVLEVQEPGPDAFIIRKRIRAAGYRKGDDRQLWSNGQIVHYRLVREGAEPASADSSVALSAATALSAAIPAVVSEVLVTVGAPVAAGEKLILLESMKMIIPIQAPYAGIVRSINCVPGEAVQPGVQLIDLDASASHTLEAPGEIRPAT